jgi:hypothetical protein
MTRLTRFTLISILVTGTLAFGQRGASPTTGPTTTTPTTGFPNTGLPGNNPNNTNPNYPNNTNTNPNTQRTPFPDQTRPIFLSGRVMLDDGTPPPEPVTIVKVCNGNGRAQGYTDSKGRFSFQLNQTQAIMQDADVSGGGLGGGNSRGMGTSSSSPGMSGGGMNGSMGLAGCEIKASLPGFRSDSVNLAARNTFDNPDVGTIILHRMANVEGRTISAVSLMAPKDAKKAFEKGRELLKKEKDAEAEKEFDKAVQLYPKYSTAWFQLGLLKEKQNDAAGARKDYAQALAADPKFLNPYHQLAGISMKEKNWQETADTTKRLIDLDPVDFPDAYFYNAVSNYYLKNFDEAEKSAREAQKLDTANHIPQTSQVLGAVLVEKQDYAGAAEQLKKYLTFLKPGEEADKMKNQLMELEKVAGGPKPE